MTSKDRPSPSPGDRWALRVRMIRFIDRFPPGGTVRTISRAGLNGMKATGLKGSAMLSSRTTRFVPPFPPGGTVRTISRAGLNGMDAIERGRRSGDDPELE